MSEQALIALAVAIVPVIISGYFGYITNRKSKEVDQKAKALQERVVDRDDFLQIKESYKQLYETAHKEYLGLRVEYERLQTSYERLAYENQSLKERVSVLEALMEKYEGSNDHDE